MDREFKLTLTLLTLLSIASGIFLSAYTRFPFFSFQFQKAYLPFILLLSPYILLSSKTVTAQISNWIATSYRKKYAVPLALIATYTIFSLFWSNFNPALFLRLTFWLILPVWIVQMGSSQTVGWKEALSILVLWIPIEFNVFSGFDIILAKDISIPALPFVASSFGLYLFTVLRPTPNVGFSFLLRWKDFGFALLMLLLLSLLLIPLGILLSFIHFFPTHVSASEILKLVLGIYFLVALPEELLFRGIIQNLLSQLFKERHLQRASMTALFIASIIFGLSHLNNYSPPNWHYVLMSMIAGLFYGFTYLKTSKCTASALVHCGVNLFWAIFFGATGG